MVLVVIAGTMVASVLLAGPDGSVTRAYLGANLGVSLGGAVLGGWVVVRLSPRWALGHAGVLAAILVVLTLPSLQSPAGGQPAWYPSAILTIGVVGVAIGAGLAGAMGSDPARRTRRRLHGEGSAVRLQPREGDEV